MQRPGSRHPEAENGNAALKIGKMERGARVEPGEARPIEVRRANGRGHDVEGGSKITMG